MQTASSGSRTLRYHPHRDRSRRPLQGASWPDHRSVAGRSRHRSAAGSMVNLCANNYLGLADHPEIVHVALEAVHRYGFGMASVRFICGTLDLHRELERAPTARYLGKDDLHPLCRLLRRQWRPLRDAC